MSKNNETWNELVKPVVVLTVICLITSALLAVTNSLTAPVIAANKEAKANAVYAAALPEAEGQFDDLTEQATTENIVAAKKASNGSGWCIQATGKGFGGDVPVIVAMDNDGVILNVSFMQNEESAGFGKRLWDGSEDGPKFAESLVGKSGSVALHEDGVDGVSGATISSTAAVKAVNSALNCYNELANGVAPAEEPKMDTDALIAEALPEAEGAFEDVTVTTANVTAAKKASNGAGYAVTATGKGFGGDVPVLVVMDGEGVIRKVAFLENGETAGYGARLWDGTDAEPFAASLEGKSGSVTLHEDGVDGLSGATLSSTAAVEAVNHALECFVELNAKEAA